MKVLGKKIRLFERWRGDLLITLDDDTILQITANKDFSLSVNTSKRNTTRDPREVYKATWWNKLMWCRICRKTTKTSLGKCNKCKRMKDMDTFTRTEDVFTD